MHNQRYLGIHLCLYWIFKVESSAEILVVNGHLTQQTFLLVYTDFHLILVFELPSLHIRKRVFNAPFFSFHPLPIILSENRGTFATYIDASQIMGLVAEIWRDFILITYVEPHLCLAEPCYDLVWVSLVYICRALKLFAFVIQPVVISGSCCSCVLPYTFSLQS
jgi:hypothetical protein